MLKKLFNRNKIKVKYDGWDKLPIKYLKKINLINRDNSISTEDKLLKIIATINDIDYDTIINLPLNEVKDMIAQSKFLYDAPKAKKMMLKNLKYLNLKGKKYEIVKDLTDITTAQFIDYNSLINDYEDKYVELLSIFIIPKGHKYNQDYDIKEVVEEIGNNLTVEEALYLSNFFINKYKTYAKRLRLYLMTVVEMTKKQMKKEKMDKKMIEQIENGMMEQIKKMEMAEQKIKEMSFLFG